MPEPEAVGRVGTARQARARFSADSAATQQGENWLWAGTCWSPSCRGMATTLRTRSFSPSGLSKTTCITSIHIEEFDVEIRETKLGREEFTATFPTSAKRRSGTWTRTGSCTIGTRVRPGDILVGKVSPKAKSELTPEEKLLHAIFRARRRRCEERLARSASQRSRRYRHSYREVLAADEFERKKSGRSSRAEV